MKLQIVDKYKRNSSICKETAKENMCTPNFDTFYPTELSQNTSDHQSITPSINNLRSFFNNFHSNCQVLQLTVPNRSQQIRKKLQPILETLNNPSQSINKERTFEIQQNLPPITFKLNNNLEKMNKINVKIDQRSNYQSQKHNQHKIRKIKSMISLSHSSDVNSAIPCSYRRPGFIRHAKTYLKRQLSLPIYGRVQAQIFPQNNSCLPPSPIKGALNEQIWRSKQRIAKIRRELTQIYKWRNNPPQNRLKLQ